jgi:hypothetical protein
MVLLGLLLLPAPAMARNDRDSAKEWLEERSEKRQKREERKERKQLLRRDARTERKSKDEYESKDRYEAKYKFKYESKYKYKYEAKDKHRSGRDKHHGHGGSGLVYGGRREHRHGHGLFYSGHRPYRPRPHPCHSWFYDGRPYDQIGHHDDDEFWHYDDSWRPCGQGRPRSIRSSYVAHLTGDQVVPPGPADTSGAANLLLIRDRWGFSGRICYRLSLRGPGTTAPLQAHIHEGHSNHQNGREVINLDLAGNGRRACRDANPYEVRNIERNPGSYYLDVHLGTFIPGVIRGQLVRAYKP